MGQVTGISIVASGKESKDRTKWVDDKEEDDVLEEVGE